MPTTESSDSTAAASLPALSPTLCDSKRRWRHLWQTHTDWPSIVCIGTSGPKIYDLRKFERGSVQARNLMLFSNHCIRRKATCRNFLMFESFFDYHDRSFYTKSEHATVTLREICLPNPFILHTMNEDDCASILRQFLDGIIELVDNVGLQHNALTLENMFLTRDGVVKIGALHETGPQTDDCGRITWAAFSTVHRHLCRCSKQNENMGSGGMANTDVCRDNTSGKVGKLGSFKELIRSEVTDADEVDSEDFLTRLRANIEYPKLQALAALGEMALMKNFRPLVREVPSDQKKKPKKIPIDTQNEIRKRTQKVFGGLHLDERRRQKKHRNTRVFMTSAKSLHRQASR